MRDFDGLAAAEADELAPILDAFARITWPAGAEVVPVFAGQLGWELLDARAAETTLPVSWRQAGFVLIKDRLAEIGFAITDALRGDAVGDPDRQAALRAAYAAQKIVVRELLGESAGSRGGNFSTVWWDLPSGGRVHVARLDFMVKAKLLSKSMADLERDEIRLGVSPDRAVL
jgi:hypothetical protein